MITTENQRVWDLLRFCRSELHTEDLITNDEYADLAMDYKSVSRLHSYDVLRSKLEEAWETASVAVETRNRAQESASANALEKQRLREVLTSVADKLMNMAPYVRGGSSDVLRNLANTCKEAAKP